MDAGIYICEITNTIATELIFYNRPITILISDCIENESHLGQN
jgi:hypothetical protein